MELEIQATQNWKINRHLCKKASFRWKIVQIKFEYNQNYPTEGIAFNCTWFENCVCWLRKFDTVNSLTLYLFERNEKRNWRNFKNAFNQRISLKVFFDNKLLHHKDAAVSDRVPVLLSGEKIISNNYWVRSNSKILSEILWELETY